jgi:hypothetical protein
MLVGIEWINVRLNTTLLIVMLCTFCCVYLWAGEVRGIFITHNKRYIT